MKSKLSNIFQLLNNASGMDNTASVISEEVITPEISLGIKREDMPQIQADKKETFKKYLLDNGIEYVMGSVPANALVPSQCELETDKADDIWKNNKAFEDSIIISDDNYLLDGHHRWLAVVQNDPSAEMECLIIGADAKKALEIMHDFEHADYQGIKENMKKITKINKLLSESLDEEKKNYKVFEKDNAVYVYNIKGVDLEDAGNLPSYFEELKKIKNFKSNANHDYIRAKGKSDKEKAVAEWLKQSGVSEFVVTYFSNGDDDTLDVYYKSIDESLYEKNRNPELIAMVLRDNKISKEDLLAVKKVVDGEVKATPQELAIFKKVLKLIKDETKSYTSAFGLKDIKDALNKMEIK